MKNTALIITCLIPEENAEELEKTTKIFKTINLTASFDEHCCCQLVDEDETPEIVRPKVATLFVSFTIWDTPDAIDTFQQKLNRISEIDINKYVSVRWELPAGELPVLNEAFGRIWFRQHLSISPANETMLFPELLKSFGRQWLLDTLGPTEDAFIYDRWVVRNTPGKQNGQSDKLSPQETLDLLSNAADRLNSFRHPFGKTETTMLADADHLNDNSVIQEKIKNFDRLFSGYNIELENWKAAYTTLNYARLANLANWAEKILGMINSEIASLERDCPVQVMEHMQSEEKKWLGAVKLFKSQRDNQYNFETRQFEINNEIFKKSFDEQAKRNKIALNTGNELLSMHNETMTKSKESFDRNLNRWKSVFGV